MFKDYLTAENTRNHTNHKIFERLLRAGTGATNTLIAHHCTFSLEGQEPNEVPSADTLMFDHTIMKNAFGDIAYRDVMISLVMEPVESRDRMLEFFLNQFGVELEQAA
jgi:hypothetical protein